MTVSIGPSPGALQKEVCKDFLLEGHVVDPKIF